MKKLLIIGSDTIHMYNYINLIKDYFDEILLITNKSNYKEVDSINLDFSLGLNIFKTVKKLQEIINSYNPTIIHTHQANSYGFITALAIKNIKTPKVITTLGSDILILPKKNLIYKWMLKYTLNSYNVVTSDSLYMANEAKNYTKNKIEIASFGINNIKVEYKDKENIIYSNRLHKKLYNIDKVIYNFANFIKNNRDWKLVIAGDGIETLKLQKLTQKLKIEDSVEFIGWVDTKTNISMYKRAKIYISIPNSDASSISLQEAIASNCICFVSNLPANSEHILDSINGFIETDIDNLDFSKYKLIDTKLLTKVNNLRKEHYLKDSNRKKFINIYESLKK